MFFALNGRYSCFFSKTSHLVYNVQFENSIIIMRNLNLSLTQNANSKY